MREGRAEYPVICLHLVCFGAPSYLGEISALLTDSPNLIPSSILQTAGSGWTVEYFSHICGSTYLMKIIRECRYENFKTQAKLTFCLYFPSNFQSHSLVLFFASYLHRTSPHSQLSLSRCQPRRSPSAKTTQNQHSMCCTQEASALP